MGLGNRAVTPDLIGPLAAEHVLVTRYLVEHLAEHFGHLRAVAAVSPVCWPPQALRAPQ